MRDEMVFSLPPGVDRAPDKFAGLVRLSDVEERPQEWLWRGYLPIGALTIIDGDPERGKSLVYIDLAARLSRGLPFPDGQRCALGAASSCIVTQEDSPETTIRPRLRIAGADLERVLVLRSVPDGRSMHAPFMLPADVDMLESLRYEHGVRLLIIDPLMGHLSGDSHRDQDVRQALGPLADTAAEHGMAVLLVRHLTKQVTGKAIHGGGGSIGIIGQARVGWFIAEHPEDDSRRVLSISKCNVARRAPSLTYALESDPDEPETPRVSWHGQAPYTANELYSKGASARVTKQDEAADRIRDFLADGPALSTDLERHAELRGIAERTLKRARGLCTDSVRIGGAGAAGAWIVHLKGDTPTEIAKKRLLTEQENSKGA